MDHRIRWVGGLMLVCFVLLFLQLNNIQVRQATALNAKSNNSPQVQVNLFTKPRGEILSADGYVLAESVPTRDRYHWRRVYPKLTARAFSGITGYYDTTQSADQWGIEGYYDSYLQYHQSPVNTLGQLLTQHNETDNVTLTVSVKLQLAAEQVLAATNQPGSALVAIDPRDGRILAMAQYPTYDPNSIAVHNYNKALKAADSLLKTSPNDNPVFNIPTFVTRAPGSTFKAVTTSAIFDHAPHIASQTFPSESSYTFPNSGNPPQKLHNYGSSICGGTLPQVLAFSCDTSFSQIGVELGAQNLALEAHAFGFDSHIPLDLPSSQVSVATFPSPSTISATPYEGYSAIGQLDDSASALQMALVASALADNGKIMAPHLAVKAVNDIGNVEFTYHPHVWRRATTAATANKVRQLMLGVTKTPGATAYGLFQSYYAQGLPPIAAKTGTAEPQKNVCGTYNWLIAFGPAGQGQTPTVAIAALVPIPSNSSSCQSNPTGASVAGPVLLPVLEQALAMQGSK